MRRSIIAVLGVSLVLLTGASTSTAVAATGTQALIRVDQVGYGTTEAKRAYLLASHGVATTFAVVDDRGRTVLTGQVGATRGRWNERYGAVQPIDFGALTAPGTYTIRAAGALSPPFAVRPLNRLLEPLVRDAVSFFTVQRDGHDVVPSPLDRKPSHLADRRASVYATPVFSGDGGDVPAAPLTRIGGPVDVEGGWFDAGDFVKFTHASAYALAELLYVEREAPADSLGRETDHGLAWLDKMWDASRRTLYVQVGIGTGSEEFSSGGAGQRGSFLGDHDVWRLPEADDALDTAPGDESFFLKYRPVFAAAAPGAAISPNLAGRVAAAFALGAQVASAHGRPAVARHLLAEGASVFALAKTSNVGELVTAFPHAYYPEDSWADDMEFGAVELARAGALLGDARSARWLRDAARWARAYLASDSQDTLNLYDTSALAHADLIAAIRSTHATGLAVTAARLVEDLRRQLDSGVDSAAENAFGQAVDVTDFDAATRSFGFAATTALYRRVTGDRSYDAFGTRQRDFVLGTNAWGVSMMVGEGTTYPHCMQHQVANLSGSLDGRRPLVRGAVVNGPNGADNFEDLGIPDGARACPVDGVNRFGAFDTADSRFLDDVRAWPSVEPAIDFTATGALALALA